MASVTLYPDLLTGVHWKSVLDSGFVKLGIDVDGTLYPFTTAVNEAVEVRYGVTGLTDHPTWNYLRDLLPEEQWFWVWSDDAAETVFGRMDLIYPGAAPVINELIRAHEVHFVTHRNPARLAGITGQWLQTYFAGYAGVHVLSNSINKATLYDWDAFIDDKPETVEQFRTADIPILVPHRPWNEECGPERFESWEQVPALLP